MILQNFALIRKSLGRSSIEDMACSFANPKAYFVFSVSQQAAAQARRPEREWAILRVDNHCQTWHDPVCCVASLGVLGMFHFLQALGEKCQVS